VAEKSTQQRGMEEAPENGKESHSAHANGMNELEVSSEIRTPHSQVAILGSFLHPLFSIEDRVSRFC